MARPANRHGNVTVNGIKLIAVYQPVSPSDGEREVPEEFGNSIGLSKESELLLIGGKHNAHIGRQNNTGKSVDVFGLEDGTSAGDDMVAWAQQNDLYIVDA